MLQLKYNVQKYETGTIELHYRKGYTAPINLQGSSNIIVYL